jgi:hypothetical protein
MLRIKARIAAQILAWTRISCISANPRLGGASLAAIDLR